MRGERLQELARFRAADFLQHFIGPDEPDTLANLGRLLQGLHSGNGKTTIT
jgi:hypothetical protein